MAKGNDGNYLQHSIEKETATRLAKEDGEGRLHISLTHGMRPYEPLDAPVSGQARRLLASALTAASQPPTPDEPPVVTRYRETGASTTRYPNSAELLRTVVGTDKLSGGIAEVDAAKHKELADDWSGSRVVPVHASWRCHVSPGRTLAVPPDLQTPWLFSMDPMTYKDNHYRDDCYLYRADTDRLAGVLAGFVASGMPGIATVFVYAVRPGRRVCSGTSWTMSRPASARTRGHIGSRTKAETVTSPGCSTQICGSLQMSSHGASESGYRHHSCCGAR